MNNYDYEKDEIIRPGKKKIVKPRTPKANHKHDYFERYVDGPIPMTVKECSICGITRILKYHFRATSK